MLKPPSHGKPTALSLVPGSLTGVALVFNVQEQILVTGLQV